MTDRVVKVSLVAQVSNYLAGMEQARKKTTETGQAAVDAKAKFEAQSQAMTQIGTGMLAVGALAAVGVGLAIKKFADFDQAMSNVSAATHESTENMSLLRDAALDAGARTVFSATEAANAIEELGKAGLETADILGGGLDAALDLAAAGGIGVAEAAGIAAVALKTFKLEGKDMAHVADLMAAGAGKAMGDVTDLAAALSQSGQIANNTGLSIDETTGSLAAFAAQGLIGSDAGTSFKSMLQRLTPQSAEAAGRMKELGISAYDAQGNFIGMEKFAGNLQTSLKDLTTEQRNSALATIFGSDAVRAATVLYSEGEEGIANWNDMVNDAGYAAETAAMRLDNLKGDVEGLGGAFDTALIKSGSAADGSLRLLVQTATGLIDIFNSAPPIVQQAALGLGFVTAAAALTGGAFLVGVPKIAAFNLALATLSTSTMPGVAAKAVFMQGVITKSGAAMAAAAKFMTGPWGLALAAAAVGVALLSTYLDSLKASAAEVGNSISTATDAAQIFATIGEGREISAWQNVTAQLKDLPKVLQAAADQSGNLFARLDTTNFGAIQALKDLGVELGTLATSDLPGAQNAFRLMSAETDGTQESQWRLLSTMPGYKDALVLQAQQLGINVTSTNEAANKTALLKLAFGTAAPKALEAADAYLAAADETENLDGQLRTLMDTINAANGIGQDAVSANAAWEASLAGIGDEVNKQKDDLIQSQKEVYQELHGNLEGFVGDVSGLTHSLDESTVAGSANADMLSGVAGKAQAAALAQYELDTKTMSAKDATDKYLLTLGLSREELRKTAIANGYNADEVQKLIDKVYALPTQKEIQILANTAAARNTLNNFITSNNGRRINLIVDGQVGRRVAGSQIIDVARATGGILPGAPSSKDNMILHAASGEFITNAAQTAIPSNRAALEFMNNGGVIKGYAGGGYVTPVQYVPQNPNYGSPGGGRTPGAPIQRISETVQVTLPSGRVLAEFIREYDRSLS